jgi:putative membrane protein
MVTTVAARSRLHWLPFAVVGVSIIAQISWVLVPAGQRQTITTIVVLLFSAATLTHAVQEFGVRWTAGFAAISASFGLLIELLGHTTDIPFGAYYYTEELQPHLLGVPVIVPLAWLMMAYPSLVLARALTVRWVVPLAAVGLTSWDLFLDPQMVGEGYWVWETTSPALPGIPGIPIQNYLGWLAGTLLLMWLLDRLPRREVNLEVPTLLYGWMWIGGIIANAVFLDRPAVALIGGAGMAILGLPAVLRWVRR